MNLDDAIVYAQPTTIEEREAIAQVCALRLNLQSPMLLDDMDNPTGRDGVQGGGTRRQRSKITGETLFGPAETVFGPGAVGRDAYKGSPRNRRPDAEQGVGGGHSTVETRENRVEGRTATSTMRPRQGKAVGLPPRGKAPSRSKTRPRKPPARLDNARKLQRTLDRVAKSQPNRRVPLLYDKVCRLDIPEAKTDAVFDNLLDVWVRVMVQVPPQ